MKQARISAQSWIEIAIEQLAEYGADALTIDALCARLQKTKGSFYAHFESHEAFLISLAAHWRKHNTEMIISETDALKNPQDRLAQLQHFAVQLDPRIDQGMRGLSERHPLIGEAVSSVDTMRTQYLADLYIASGAYSKSEAQDLATIEYAAYVGLYLIGPKRDQAELDRLYRTFTNLLARKN